MNAKQKLREFKKTVVKDFPEYIEITSLNRSGVRVTERIDKRTFKTIRV